MSISKNSILSLLNCQPVSQSTVKQSSSCETVMLCSILSAVKIITVILTTVVMPNVKISTVKTFDLWHCETFKLKKTLKYQKPSNIKKTQTQKPWNPKTLKNFNPETLKSSSPKTLKLFTLKQLIVKLFTLSLTGVGLQNIALSEDVRSALIYKLAIQRGENCNLL